MVHRQHLYLHTLDSHTAISRITHSDSVFGV
jgi:hypothetical protein